GWARPVRTLASWCLSVSIDFAILSVACFLMSAMLMNLPSVVDECTLVLPHHDTLERSRLENGKDVDRELLVAAQGERRGVHHLEVLHERLVESDALVAGRGLVLQGIGRIDAVHLGRLEDHVRLDLAPAQRRRRVGGEEGIARA